MGESPQESAATSQRDDLARLQERLLNGDLSGRSTFGQIDPYFTQASDIISRGIPDIEASLNALFGARSAQLGQATGQSLVTSGVAPGHDRGSAFVSAMSPAIGENLSNIANLRKFGISSLADISKLRGLTLADLIKFSTSAGLQAQGLENQAIGGMKDTTAAGDIMGGITMLSKLFAALASAGLFSSGASPGSFENPYEMPEVTVGTG